ncbi:MAG: isoleucine--tRNA ligase [Thermoplasmata archaeon]|nr:MAG: isoleucine--tRNA ligase [Thermoplasmata archaeon]
MCGSGEQQGPRDPVVENEEEMLRFWRENDVIRKSLERGEGGPYFRFLEGPPTANAPPGVHHIYARTVKDIINKHRAMKGYYVPRMGGWDCHGLPVEISVERELGIKSKEEIEKYGVERFIEMCKRSVFTHIEDWSKTTERMGYFLDLERPYITMDTKYMESIWWSLKTLWEKGLLYQDYSIVPYCPRCGTPLSSHEVAQGYKDITEPSIYVKFRVEGEENLYFLAWTTTPWTLISNVALAVNPDFRYAEVEVGGERLILAVGRLKEVLGDNGYTVIRTFEGSEMEGKRYEPLYNFKNLGFDAHFVILGEFVTLEEGTGIVHIAPAFGEEDFEVGKVYSLPVLQLVNEKGEFVDEVEPWREMFVKDADPLIIEDLRRRGLLHSVVDYTHTYPFCWRCGAPLLYYARDAWFIKMSTLREELLKNNEEINWVPEFIKHGRFGNFLKEVKDWTLSRERYWGTPLPIWECPGGHRVCVGSIDELEKLSGRRVDDLHRPTVDPITFPCPECGKEMKRVPYVIDVWYDSGSAPFASLHYPFENGEEFERQFPRDYISEAIDQTRGWFYSLLAISTAVFNRPAYLNVICLDLILDEKGEKMSKSRGNVVDPWEVFRNEGADALRWYLLVTSPPWKPKNFSRKLVLEAKKRFISVLWNVYTFYRTYSELDGYRPRGVDERVPYRRRAAVDRWILSRLNRLVKYVDERLTDFDYHPAAEAIERFVSEELSNWYVRVNRRRFWKMERDEDKYSAYDTLQEVLHTLSRLLAPFVVFITERIYREVRLPTEPESVHLADYPEPNEGLMDEGLERRMEVLLHIVGAGREARAASRIKNRQPLKTAYVAGGGDMVEEVLQDEELLKIALGELNVKEIKPVREEEILKRRASLDARRAGPRLRGAMKAVMEELEGMDPEKVYDILSKEGSIMLAGETLTMDDFMVEEALPGNLKLGEEGGLKVYLDTVIDEGLRREGLAKEIVRRIQVMRKDMNLPYDATIKVWLKGDREMEDAARSLSEYILKETLSKSLVVGEGGGSYSKEWEVDGLNLFIGIER